MSSIRNQRTIKNEIMLQGVGLHTGRKCRAWFKPAPANSGITFIRIDLPGKPAMKAVVDQVVDIVRGTTLGSGDARVYTIEHILSALNGLQIDNMTIELDDNEPPVLDGSSIEFIQALHKAGIEDQAEPKNFFTVEEPVEYSANQTVIRIEPADEFTLDCEIEYDHPLIKSQKLVFTRSSDYEKEVAPARTFCFDYEIEALKKNGLAKGGSLDNAIVVGPTGIYNEGNVRFKDEFVRHKTLDLLGDLMLLGTPIKAKIIAKRCGHGHNIKFLRKLLEARSAPSPIPVN